MERSDHWNEANTTALIQGIGGIAGNIIQAKQAGKPVTYQDQQIAALAQQTQQALYDAQNKQQAQSSALGAGGITTIVLVGGVFLVIVFLLFKFNK